MKRDLVAIRFILRKLEETTDPSVYLALPEIVDSYAAIFGDSPETRMRLVAMFKLLQNENFVSASRANWAFPDGAKTVDVLTGITWRGYNLIDAIDEERSLDTV